MVVVSARWRAWRRLQVFSVIAWVPIDEVVARTAGSLARTHRPSQGGIDDADCLIAATALVLDAELLTTNTRHFPMLEGRRPLY